LLLDHGAELRDPPLLAVLLDDADAVKRIVNSDARVLNHRATLVSAFTSLVDVSLLHVAAEYGNLNAAQALIELGADVNASAGLDEDGMNGHTPIFHTVNSIGNRSEPIMRMLLDAGADCSVRLAGLHWGKGYEWATVFFDVTPISYAQMGLMPQVHRNESDIYSNIKVMMQRSSRKLPPLENVPNRYLRPRTKG
jgi:ankyrin repeat protein